MIRFPDAVKALMAPADTVTPHPENANSGDVDEIVQSLHINGCYRPIYYSTATGHIIGGHHLYEALLSEGYDQIPLLPYENLTPEDELRILAADNRIARLARMDVGLELAMLKKLKDSDTGLAGTGYDEEYLRDLSGEAGRGFSGEDIDVEEKLHCPHCGAAIEPGTLV